ncbi:MAG: DUF6686 family protein [Cytophagales bacterium]
MKINNCEYIKLIVHTNGYVVKCVQCKQYQLAFGTNLCNFKELEFGLLNLKVCSLKAKALKMEKLDKNVKNIVIEIIPNVSSLILNFSELLELEKMISEAIYKEKLLNLSKINLN